MNAKVATRLDLENPRTHLQDVIPLRTPYVLMVDPASACNLRCKFCPTGDLKLIRSTGRYQGYMRLAQFRKLVDDSVGFPDPVKVLRLYKEGDPLVNPNLPEMIRYAKDSGKFLRIDTTTNGVLLNPKLNERLVSAGLDQINISVNGVSSEQFRSLTQSKVDFDKFVAGIRDLYENRGDCEVYIKCIGENFSPSEQDRFFDIFSRYADRIFVEHLQPNWPEFNFDYINVSYAVGHYGQDLVERQVCPFIFYMIVVNADLSVSLCVQDWAHKLLAGNAAERSIVDIWNGETINYYRRMHLERRRCELSVCSVCPVMKHGVLDDIDPHAEIVLKRLIPIRSGQ